MYPLVFLIIKQRNWKIEISDFGDCVGDFLV